MDMASWMGWLLMAGVVVIAEIFTGTFYLLMIALGMLAGAGLAAMGASSPTQTIVAGVVAVIASVILRRSKWGKTNKTDTAQDRNVNLDIGQVLHVQEWMEDGLKNYSARTAYRGAQWDVDLQHGHEARPGRFVIREVRGSRLIVAPE